jgi:hypothetical protein
MAPDNVGTLTEREIFGQRRPAINTTRTLFILTLAFCLGELFWAFQQLPERVHAHLPAWVHFGAEGPKWVFVAVSALIPVVIALAALISIRLVKVQPQVIAQIPHRDYWLDPSRRGRTMEMIVSRIYLLGAVKFIADAVFIYAAVRANLAGTTELDPTLLFYLGAGFVIAKILLAAQLFWRFQFPERSRAAKYSR